ncbi:MAG TPA: hypothetical protein VN969_07810 [Streptosporangiaceae bacterium]|nr:hypothetical protein [Streptosporangiaceae bacterium]
MELVQVDGVGAEPAQRRGQRPVQVPPGRPGVVGVASGPGPALGGDDRPVGDLSRSGREPSAQGFLGYSAVVDICGVDQVAALRYSMIVECSF